MRATPANSIIRIGPGVFNTKGFCEFLAWGWEVKSGQNIFGASIGLTTLKLVNCVIKEHQFYAIGSRYNDFLDGAEIAQLTIDCNVDDQGLPGYIACAAVNLRGSRLKLRRLRAIHFGSQTVAYVENFVFVLSASVQALNDPQYEPVDCVIEDCVAEYLSRKSTQNSFLFAVGGGEFDFDPSAIYERANVIRNCYGNCDYEDGGSSLTVAVLGAGDATIIGITHESGRQFRLRTKTRCRGSSRQSVYLSAGAAAE